MMDIISSLINQMLHILFILNQDNYINLQLLFSYEVYFKMIL